MLLSTWSIHYALIPRVFCKRRDLGIRYLSRVADHMPFPGAVEELAGKFNITLTNGFTIDNLSWNATIFRRQDGLLSQHPIVNGRNREARIDSIFTYSGNGFPHAIEANGFMKFGVGIVSCYPQEAWRFDESTPIVNMDGWYQGIAVSRGKGKIVVL